MKRCVIIGASGFGKEIAWVICRINSLAPSIELIGFCDDASEKQSGSYAGYSLLGSIENGVTALAGCRFICAIGNNRMRQHVTARANAAGLIPLTIVDPTACIAPDAIIGEGSYIGIGSVVSTGATLGCGVIVNHQACVGHDVTLGDFSQVCPGARISGGCAIGEGALLGTNAAVIPLKKMGPWSILGAGATAMRDIPDGATIVRLKG